VTSHTLRYDKETPNKHRWTCHVGGVEFKLYLPQTVIPDPQPRKLNVTLCDSSTDFARLKANLKSEIELAEVKTETIRYHPVGPPDTWVIGEPYIPKTVLPEPWPRRLWLAVSWVD
jgi:hypothetical protein